MQVITNACMDRLISDSLELHFMSVMITPPIRERTSPLVIAGLINGPGRGHQARGKEQKRGGKGQKGQRHCQPMWCGPACTVHRVIPSLP